MTLPPWLRALQQTYLFHVIVVPGLMTAGMLMWDCANKDISNLSWACLKGAAIGAANWAIPYVVGALQHSPNSASFLPTGEVNEQVQRVKVQ